MAPLIFVSDNKVTPSIPRNFFSKSSAHPAEWPKKLLIDKDYSSAPAVMVMTRQALDRMLLSPRHDFTEAIGSASNVYLDERTNRFVQVDRSTDKRQDTRGLGILRWSPEARRLHALMEAISDLPVVTVLWADILQVASLNAVEFTNGQTPGSTMSTEAFAHDYPYGLLERLKSPEIAFISAVDGSPLLSRQERPYGTTWLSRNPYFKDISPDTDTQEIVAALRSSLVPSLEHDLSPARRYART